MPITPLNRFIRASDAIFRDAALFESMSDDNRSIFTLQIQGDELKLLWNKVKSTYETYIDSADDEAEDITAANSKYNATYQAYVICLASIMEKIEELKLKNNQNSPSVNNANLNGNSCHNLTLPPCDVDIFEGDYKTWPTFRDLFTALYINSSTISNIERLFHLIRKTTGEAREIVSGCPLTNLGFDIAWKNLCRTYENPRMLVNNQLKILFSLPNQDVENISGLKTLQRGINGCLSALSLYDIPTQDWDPIIVFMCIQRLPMSTVSLWEQNVKDKSTLSSWKDMDSFLTERIQTLECLHDLKGNGNQSIHSNSNTTASISCILCPNRGHFLRNCQRFRNMSISDRISTVNRNNCCTNCLSQTHNADSCMSNKNCSICNNRHHTMLHPPVAQDTTTVLRPYNPTHNQIPSSSTANRQSFHVRQDKSVVLGTAMINIMKNGRKSKVRALIDPASESSFVTENLQKRLNLKTYSTNTTISGVNNSVTTVARETCDLKICSDINPSSILDTRAFVLPSISGNLPSISFNADVQNLLPNIRLADSNPFSSRPVEILIGADLYPQVMLSDIRTNILGSLLAQDTIFGYILTGPINKSSLTANHNMESNLLRSIP